MRYCFYQTTNLINGKKYLGIHGSEDFNKDSYLGSGTLLREAIKKYGKENFVREDLRYFNTLQEAKDFERLSITPEILQSKDYYNIAEGGGGGSRGSKPFYVGSKKYLVSPEAISKFLEKHPEAVAGMPESYADQQRVKMKGRVTIHRGEEHRLVRKEDLNQYLEKGWVKGSSEKMVQRNSASKVGIKIMHKGDITRHVRLLDVPRFLEDGYEFGPSKWISKQNGESHRDRIKVHKGNDIRFIPRGELESYLKSGYERGNSPKEIESRKASTVDTVFINKNGKERRIPLVDLEKFRQRGWTQGRSESVLQCLSKRNTETAKIRRVRSKEEAATRKLIYTKSKEFQNWWKKNAGRFERIHYSVKYFLSEVGLSKSEFLQKMKLQGEL